VSADIKAKLLEVGSEEGCISIDLLNDLIPEDNDPETIDEIFDFLHDLGYTSLPSPDDPAIALRVIEAAGQQRGLAPVPSMELYQIPHCPASDERGVAAQY